METPKIPYAKEVWVEPRPPLKILHITTDLQHHPSTPGYDAERHEEMMRAIGALVGPRCEYDRYEIHAPDNP